jgi:hypothetical protein
MRHPMLALALASLIPACGGSSTPGPSPVTPVITVGGDYTTAVALVENTCGDVTVMPLATRVEHAAGAATIRLTHGSTYDCSLTTAGRFVCTARTFEVGGRQETVTVDGQFRRDGFDATARVAVQPVGCAYSVRWTGTKQGAQNVLP